VEQFFMLRSNRVECQACESFAKMRENRMDPLYERTKSCSS